MKGLRPHHAPPPCAREPRSNKDATATMTTPRNLRSDRRKTVYSVLFAIGFAHLLNDMMQSVIPAVYPLLKEKFGFSFAQIGAITLVFQLTSSLLQPVAGRLAAIRGPTHSRRACVSRSSACWRSQRPRP